MKKLMSVIVLLASLTARAQIGYGPEAGVTFSDLRITSPYYSVPTSLITGAHIGFVLDLDLSKSLYLQSGLSYTMRGTKEVSGYSTDSVSDNLHTTLHVNYIQLPINIVYKTGRQGTNRFFVGAGILLSEGISGHGKDQDHYSQLLGNTYTTDTTTTYKVTFGYDIKAFDFGFNFIAGYEMWDGWFIKVNYSLGLSNLSTYGYETDRSQYFGATLGYYFGKGRHTKLDFKKFKEEENTY